MAPFSEYLKFDGLGLAELVRAGQVHPGELVESAIERIERFNPQLNAVVHTMFDSAFASVSNGPQRGPFGGVPFLVKDLGLDVAGVSMTSGSRPFRNYRSHRDSELMVRFRRAGFNMLGRTNVPEFGLTGYTEPELFGACRNPWNPRHSSGGSSGGSASAVAAGFVPVAHGSDGGGSIRIPASACGLVGLKPTRGRTPPGIDGGDDGYGFVVAHGLTRSVRDSAALLDAIHGSYLGDPYHVPPPAEPYLAQAGRHPGRLRIAISKASIFGTQLASDCVDSVERAGALCADLGHVVEEATPAIPKAELVDAFLTLFTAALAHAIQESGQILGKRLKARDLEPFTWVAGILGRRCGAVEISTAIQSSRNAGRQLEEFFQTYDVLLSSTLGTPPTRIGELSATRMERLVLGLVSTIPLPALLGIVRERMGGAQLDAFPNTMLFNMTGHPAMNVPLHWNAAGLPVGVQIASRFGDESTLFRLAGQLEKAHPWAGRWPTLVSEMA